MNKATAILLKKLKYIFKHKYNPYPFYWFDLITETDIEVKFYFETLKD